MDLRDFQILLELNRHPFASNGRVGREIGMTGNAVRARLNRMQGAGLLNGFFVMPAASLFRRHWHVFAYQGLDPEPEFRRILAVDDVVNVWRGGPRSLMVNTYSSTRGASPPPELAPLLKRIPDGVVLPEPPNIISESDTVLSPLDWRVLDALLDGPRKSLVVLAQRTGLSARTVRKRRDTLVSKGLLRVIPNIDTSRESGLIVYSGYVVARHPTDLDQLHAQGLSVIAQLFQPPAAWVLGHASSYAELQEVELTLRTMPGVVSVELVPSRGGAVATSRLRGWIRAELAKWDVARRRGESRR